MDQAVGREGAKKGSKATEAGGAAAKVLFEDLQPPRDVESKQMLGGYDPFLDV